MKGGKTFDQLPEDVLRRIFFCLQQTQYFECALVCHRWLATSAYPLLWRKINLVTLDLSIAHIRNLFINLYLRHVQDINISEVIIDPNILYIILKHALFFRNLALKNFKLKNYLKTFDFNADSVSFNKEMIRLDIRDIHNCFIDLLYPCLNNSSFECLEALGIGNRDMSNFSPVIREFSSFFGCLTSLKILDCHNLKSVNDDVVQVIAENLKNLEYLGLRGCQEVKGQTLSVLLKNCTKLKSLILESTGVRSDEIQKIDWSKYKIEELDLSDCAFVTDHALIHMLPKLANINYLCLNMCGKGRAFSNNVITQCINADFLAKLQVLSLNINNKITFQGFEKLCQPIGRFHRLIHLQELSLNSCQTMQVQNFTSSLLSNLPNLRVFEIGDLANNKQLWGNEVNPDDLILYENTSKADGNNGLQVELYQISEMDNLLGIDIRLRRGMVEFLYNLSVANKMLKKLKVANRYYTKCSSNLVPSLRLDTDEHGAVFRSVDNLLKKCKYLELLAFPGLEENLKEVVEYTVKENQSKLGSNFSLDLRWNDSPILSKPRRSLDYEFEKLFK